MSSDHDRIRVLYVINGLGTGGAERSLAEMLGPLEDQGVEVSVACLERRSEGVEPRVRAEHDVVFIDPGLLPRLRDLRSHIRDLEPDLVHTTLFDSDIYGRLAAIGTSTPVVTSIVNTSYGRPSLGNPDVPRSKLRIAQAIDGWTARHLTKRFHALTQASADEASHNLGLDPGQIVVIPRGRDRARLGERTDERRARVRAELGVGDRRFLLLSVGRREHQKGQLHAIEAMKTVHRSHPEAMLVIAGRDGAASERLSRARNDSGLEDVVWFLGHREDVPDLMVAADLLVFPSLYEGFGGTVIEAMALGLPAVVSDIPTLREVVAGTSLSAPPGDSGRLAEVILAGIESPSRLAELAARASDLFTARYTLDNVAKEMARFYRTTVGVTGGE